MKINDIKALRKRLDTALDDLARLERLYLGCVGELVSHVRDDQDPDRLLVDWSPNEDLIKTALSVTVNADRTVTYGYTRLCWDDAEKTWKEVTGGQDVAKG